ncbi:2-keto-3-deoxy-6-phosphogluconate aldolase [Clostridium algifaecis]|uniref:2-keto-3-deoxy-6-phosphogluconate aldolase n=1 Tax=Clostridium algifaecis TaxID=1472040 RepID=A0ABS4KQH5_9CLOT|nr:hydrolase [Clostridium algifaecis]MBP2032279.1 2-keto-3-deoxy-6-phosphogluconate aldolase [Clostridium algifaecis]
MEKINEKVNKYVPEIRGTLRDHMINVPRVIRESSGIKVFGKRIKSFAYTTDVAVIKNIDADAVFAVYPFTPQSVITEALVGASDIPVFCGVGGGLTMGKRVINLALNAEFTGAMGVVVNSPTSNKVIEAMSDSIDIPIIVTVVSEKDDIQKRIDAGVSILNVSAGKNTAALVKKIRSEFPEFPIMATGGRSEKEIVETIKAGANAISYTPPSTAELFKDTMEKYRNI